MTLKRVFQTLTIVICVAGCVVLFRLSANNRQLLEQIDHLEADLGSMPITQPDRVYMVETQSPDVPPEVASHVLRTWQFRCYLPAGYNFVQFCGDGRVTADGLYLRQGGSNQSWRQFTEPTQQLLIVSLQKVDDRLVACYSFGGSSATLSLWGYVSSVGNDPSANIENLVVQQWVHRDQGPRSFDPQTILPLLKIYDSSSAKAQDVQGQTVTTYQGAMIVLCPRSREAEFNQLRDGVTPEGFKPSWIATETTDE